MSEPVESARWYVLKTFRNELRARQELGAELALRRQAQAADFRFFVPVHYRVESRGGHRAPQAAPLLPNYVFVRTTLDCVFALKRQFPYLYIYPPRDADGVTQLAGCVSVPDAEMQSFIIVARAYEHDQRFYQVEPDAMAKGDRVRIVGGTFDGVEGILECDQGRAGGRVTVTIPGVSSIRTWEIPAEHIQYLEFAPEGRRIYAHFSAFQRKASAALLHHHSPAGATADDVSQMLLFIRRLAHVRTESDISESTLRVLLLAAYTVTDNAPMAQLELQRSLTLAAAATGDTHRAFLWAYIFAATLRPDCAARARAITDAWPADGTLNAKRRAVLALLDSFGPLASPAAVSHVTIANPA